MTTRRKFLQYIAALTIGLSESSAFGQEEIFIDECDLLKSTFIMPENGIFEDIDPDCAVEYFDILQSMKFKKVFFQWSISQGVPAKGINTLIAAAQKSGIDFVIGLTYNLEKRDAPYYDHNNKNLEDGLKEISDSSIAQVNKFIKRGVLNKTHFKGWYIPTEMNGKTISDQSDNEYRYVKDRADIWSKYLVNLYNEINNKSVNSVSKIDIYTSSYIGNKPHISSVEFANFWEEIWRKVPLIMLHQDSALVKHISHDQLKDYMEKIISSAKKTNARCGLVVELGKNIDPKIILKSLNSQLNTAKIFKNSASNMEVVAYEAAKSLFNVTQILQTSPKRSEFGNAYKYKPTCPKVN